MQKLFEISSGGPHIAAHTTATITQTLSWDGCVPLSIHCNPDSTEHFRFHGVHGGVEPLIEHVGPPLYGQNEPRPPRHASELSKLDALLPVVLRTGADFSVTVENISDRSWPFFCEVWGIDKLAHAKWHALPLGNNPHAIGSIILQLRCHKCSETFQLKHGDRIPLWCHWCIEDQSERSARATS